MCPANIFMCTAIHMCMFYVYSYSQVYALRVQLIPSVYVYS